MPILIRSTLVATLLLTACASPDIDHYRNEQPAFDPSVFFAGHTEAWGMFQKRNGEVVRRFTVDMEGAWQGKEFVLNESFIYNDGERQHRQWHLVRTGTNSWSGTASDVVGTATGQTEGNALQWEYVLTVPVGSSSYDFSFDDWSYLIDKTHAVNRASMRKFGIEVGQVTLFFTKPAP
ncbi:MAG: DUF3833 domain-containing protein [Burkholderiales bacterium]|nr:DUF3833 domain-containing protein [Burkholderiales bacterium]